MEIFMNDEYDWNHNVVGEAVKCALDCINREEV